MSFECRLICPWFSPPSTLHRILTPTLVRVTNTSLATVLASAAYMCFYVKRHLDYKPYMTPSYIVAREAEAVKEKEREREKEAALMREVEDDLLATV